MKSVSHAQKFARPGYPSQREHLERKALLGAVAVGMSAIVAGCATQSVQSAGGSGMDVKTMGAMVAEPLPTPVVTNECRATLTVGLVREEPQARVPGTMPVPAPVSTDKDPGERLMIYVVQKGDTLSALAERWLGGASRWPEIIKANPGLVPEKLQVGRAIRLPVAGAASANLVVPL